MLPWRSKDEVASGKNEPQRSNALLKNKVTKQLSRHSMNNADEKQFSVRNSFEHLMCRKANFYVFPRRVRDIKRYKLLRQLSTSQQLSSVCFLWCAQTVVIVLDILQKSTQYFIYLT